MVVFSSPQLDVPLAEEQLPYLKTGQMKSIKEARVVLHRIIKKQLKNNGYNLKDPAKPHNLIPTQQEVYKRKRLSTTLRLNRRGNLHRIGGSNYMELKKDKTVDIRILTAVPSIVLQNLLN